MKRIPLVTALVSLPAPALAAPPASSIATLSGAEVYVNSGNNTFSHRFALPNNELYGVDQASPASVFLDYFWDENQPYVEARFIARACRQSYKGTLVCGPDAVIVNPTDDAVLTALVSTVGITEPNVTSRWDSYFVEYDIEIQRADGRVTEADRGRPLGVGVSYSSEGATALPTTNIFTFHDAEFRLRGEPDSFGRQRLRANLPNDQVYGFHTTAQPTIYVDFMTASQVPYFDWSLPSNPQFEPVDHSKYNLDYDAKACRQSWTGSTAVCGPDSNRHNPAPGHNTHLYLDTSAITSPTNSTFDHYYAEVMGGITEDWTSAGVIDYDGRALLRDWRYEDDGRILAGSVAHGTTLSDFATSTRKSKYLPRSEGPQRTFGVHNDTVYGLKAASTESFYMFYYVHDLPSAPATTQLDVTVRLCRESFTGSTVVCAPDSTQSHTTFDVHGYQWLSTAGVVSEANSAWDYYYGSFDELHHHAGGTTSTRFAVLPLSVSAGYNR